MAKLFSLTLLLLSFLSIAGEVSNERQQYLRNMVQHDCGSCHGITLKGGLGPALTAQALANKSDDVLQLTILKGRVGTPMPPFESLLSMDEVKWIIKWLRRDKS